MLDDLYQLRERARASMHRGDLDDAANSLVAAAQQTHVAEHDYLSVLRPLVDVLLKRGDARSALTVQWYMAFSEPDGWRRAMGLLPHVPAVDRARTLAATNDMAGAAREMENAGLVAQAAIYREKADDWRGARALWSRLAQVVGGGPDAYNAALVEFNLARCANKCGDTRQARE
ncbi:MAG TPA: HEAT repeat domain-containing protein, partial [Labilithrix sp.]|nr:HEAT repeat domain-containing protein [Labilithrix sp.]